ncbi:hypothetical protein BCR36DRAFT_294098 [Piromyces finnis]|uniref:Tafazzin family protein n=1 Tax=Piromyces finnis TaxID=1754191 RepID=A0A1Y1V7C2_9FUNG|nr:hypothetical protein BCR36DRAFT_294098 [Piromyces finnis]|eukprot:ORX48174.1 hypothetical protein BCR36DRAFT_294098 [Piromyces finnis]
MLKNCYLFPNRLERLILNRPKDVPLITYCNHLTVIDDPVIWGGINKKCINPETFRHTVGAKELCSGKGFLNDFFNAAKIITVIRGNGVYQKDLDKAVEVVNSGEWLHIFPEGKIHPNKNSRINDFKWGIGRFIMESKKCPIVVPIYIHDLDKVIFVNKPFINLKEKFVISYGNPVNIEPLFNKWNKIRNNTKKLAKANIHFKSTKEADSFLNSDFSLDINSESNFQNSSSSMLTQHIWERLSRSKNKAFSIVPTVFKPLNYLNPLKYSEDDQEHFMINGIQVIRSQFTNILKEGLITLKKETQDWISNKQQQLSSNFKNPSDFQKRFRINIYYDNES